MEDAFPGLTFQNPTFAAMPPAQDAVWWIGEREGRIIAVAAGRGTPVKHTVLDIRDRTLGWQDVGLLNLVFHPEFGRVDSPNRRFVYLWYNYRTRPPRGPRHPPQQTSSRTRLSRFSVKEGAMALDLRSEQVLIDQFRRNTEHMGSGMFFHPEDGFLYLGVGDGGRDLAVSKQSSEFVLRPSSDPQRIDRDLLSGVLRIDVDRRGGSTSHPIRRQPRNGRTQGYFIPSDNPWLDRRGGVLEEFFAIGLRNPHRMSHDPGTRQIFVGDVGHFSFEEINLLERGANYEWNFREGDRSFRAPPASLIGTRRSPVFALPHVGFSAVIGGEVYRGRTHPELVGTYLFGDNGSGRIFAMPTDGARRDPRVLFRLPPGMIGYGGLSSFARDHQGEIYFCVLGDNDRGTGTIQKLVRRPPRFPAAARTLSATGLFDDLRALRPRRTLFRYEVNVPFWSDHSLKTRWVETPAGKPITFQAQGNWTLPPGAVAVKHFDLALDENNQSGRRRLETRVLTVHANGEVQGLLYKWRPDQTDADLITEATTEHFTAVSKQPFGPLAVATLGGVGQGAAYTEAGRTVLRPPAGGTVFAHDGQVGEFDVALSASLSGPGQVGLMLRSATPEGGGYVLLARDFERDASGQTIVVEVGTAGGGRPAVTWHKTGQPWLRMHQQGGALRLFSSRDGQQWSVIPASLGPLPGAQVGVAARASAGQRSRPVTAEVGRLVRCEQREHYYPSASECGTCHNRNANYFLGLSARQWNRTVPGPVGAAVNQLQLASDRSMFDRRLGAEEQQRLGRLSPIADRSASAEQRARSYLDANCSQCHRPGGVVQVTFDARYETALAHQQLVRGVPRWPSLPVPADYIIAPRDPSRSLLLRRLEAGEMPPLGSLHVDDEGIATIREWILGLPGPPTLDEVRIEADRDDPVAGSLQVRLRHPDPQAEIRYTTDDTPPDVQSRRYRGPLEVTAPLLIRAVAVRPGFVPSRSTFRELTPGNP